MWDIEFYETEDSRKPVQEFLDSLNMKMRAKAIKDILTLRELGNTIREPYSKSMGGGVFELRIKFASDITRIFYFFYVGQKIVLANGIVKKTQKTPPEELRKAHKYKADYERRHSND
ncbi:hypothetical protein FACS18949_14250 [Clostridia bacterium]|nr:hypothetical protein FACS189425_07060 [Clostridia bacterium]GHV35732.1 hypothetical protein FACS18949_14250 [Clostridia bacterium]